MPIDFPDLDKHGWRGWFEGVLSGFDEKGEPHAPGERLVIYYSYPTGVNSLFSVEGAAQLFSRWDSVVFGQPLQEPDHEEHDNTVAVIDRIHELNPRSKIFGYVSISVANGAGPPLTDQEVIDRIDAWHVMGVDGLLVDEAGFDYQVPRARQNMALDHIHGLTVVGTEAFGSGNRKMVALVNVWVQSDMFAPSKAAALAVDPNIVQASYDLYNPGNTPSTALPGDYSLLETWVIHTDFYPGNHSASIFNIRARADHARHYRDTLGVRWFGGSVVNYGSTDDEDAQVFFDLTQAFALMFGADGWAVDALDYSANVANLAVVKAWDYDRRPYSRNAMYSISNDWFTITRQDLRMRMVGTSTDPGASTWTTTDLGI